MWTSKLRIYTLTFLIVVLGITLIHGASVPSPKLELIDPDAKVTQQNRIVIHGLEQEPFSVAEDRKSLQAYRLITFDLPEVPKTAKLELVMTVVSYACGVKPGLPQGQTNISVNQKPVAYFSFSYLDQGQSYRTSVDVDPTFLRVGQNQLEIVGSRCKYGFFEVVRFNGIALAK